MLFEQRTYTLQPGNTDAFWAAQQARGFDLVRPILERLVGYFRTKGGAREQVIHLYCFDDYHDWVERLHGLYGVPELEPYFRTVRPLMLAQENEFLAPAPLTELCPHWGDGRGKAVRAALGASAPALGGDIVIEQVTAQLLPGGLPAYWEGWRRHGLRCGAPATARLLGVFSTLVGAQHKITSYRWHRDLRQHDEHAAALAACQPWQRFLESIQDVVVRYETRLLAPAPLAPMSPLFAHRPRDAWS